MGLVAIEFPMLANRPTYRLWSGDLTCASRPRRHPLFPNEEYDEQMLGQNARL